jgi:hypothetical protein
MQFLLKDKKIIINKKVEIVMGNLYLLAEDSGISLGTLQAVLEGGVPLILAVLVVIAGYVIFKLVKYIQDLQKELQSKIQELLEKQLDQQGPLTEALTQTTEALKKAEESIEENTKTLAEARITIKDLTDG